MTQLHSIDGREVFVVIFFGEATPKIVGVFQYEEDAEDNVKRFVKAAPDQEWEERSGARGLNTYIERHFIT